MSRVLAIIWGTSWLLIGLGAIALVIYYGVMGRFEGKQAMLGVGLGIGIFVASLSIAYGLYWIWPPKSSGSPH